MCPDTLVDDDDSPPPDPGTVVSDRAPAAAAICTEEGGDGCDWLDDSGVESPSFVPSPSLLDTRDETALFRRASSPGKRIGWSLVKGLKEKMEGG